MASSLTQILIFKLDEKRNIFEKILSKLREVSCGITELWHRRRLKQKTEKT